MDHPGSSISAAPQQAPAPRASIQDILTFNYPRPADAVPRPPAPPAGTVGAQLASADGQPHPPAHESEYTNEGSAQSPAESSPRRRNINSSKRAAQNRAAQRAFRLRRERYVAGLEEKARNYDRLEAALLDAQRENYHLRARLAAIHSENVVLRTHIAASGSPPLPPGAAAPMPSPPMVAALSGVNPISQFLAARPAALAEPSIYYHYHGLDPRQPHLKQAPPIHAPYRHPQSHHPHAVGYMGAAHPAEAGHAQALQHSAQAFPLPPSAALARPGSSAAAPGRPGPGLLMYNPPPPAPPPEEPTMGCEQAPAEGPVAAGPMLPSVREITMSIGAAPPVSPCAERGLSPLQTRLLDDRSQGGECTESRMRPW